MIWLLSATAPLARGICFLYTSSVGMVILERHLSTRSLLMFPFSENSLLGTPDRESSCMLLCPCTRVSFTVSPGARVGVSPIPLAWRADGDSDIWRNSDDRIDMTGLDGVVWWRTVRYNSHHAILTIKYSIFQNYWWTCSLSLMYEATMWLEWTCRL